VSDLWGIEYGIVALCAVMVGFTKSGLPGLLILVVPLMASVLPARTSVGVLLGMLILADVIAAAYYRHQVLWRHIFRLLPLTVAGIVVGYFGLHVVDNEQLKPMIGIIVLVMLGINYWRTRAGREDRPVPTQWWFAAVAGFTAGVMTMMANAAGPVMILYLLSMRLPKYQFVGTTAWFFFIVNWVKVPFSANLNLMTSESVKLDLMMLPFIVMGAIAGIVILKRIPLKVFNHVIQILAALAAIKLFF
jgi:uncharacterized membrane protein YfcA